MGNDVNCAKCGRVIAIGRVYRGRIYCRKCYEIKKGVRDEKGIIKNNQVDRMVVA